MGSNTTVRVSVADRDCRADHRGSLVGSPVLWSRQASTCRTRQGQAMKKPGTTMRRNGTVRCAIYTRRSSEEGLEQEFNSQAQREACEASIDSKRHEGWICVRTGYDNGGVSGSTMDRPALQQLIADIAAG